LDNFANKQLFTKVDGIWEAKFTPGEDLST